MLEGIEHAHKRDILHRDISPMNIMITPEGTAKLLDFGVARARAAGAEQRPEHRPEHRSDEIAGTVPFIAPEVFGDFEVGRGADIYTLGATFFYAPVGEPPHGDGSLATVGRRALTQWPRPVPEDVPEDLHTFVSFALGPRTARIATWTRPSVRAAEPRYSDWREHFHMPDRDAAAAAPHHLADW